MYVVTFYSFKGGTGRSMALANVAADLVSRGRRVLMVDFDLEAPGLDTFPMTLDRPIDKGLVEMITDYSESELANPPSVEEYVYEAHLEGMKGGNLWIMPAGRQDSSYDSRFRRIDWQDLYAHVGGFYFFEDLKAQWEQSYRPDYVLIDSRTGHTDIGGICTRQLPDCVVAMFFPNEQNLRGLAPVALDIRKEEATGLQKKIQLHFVMGNVPDLDDEEEIFAQFSAQSSKLLAYTQLSATIHHFSSLTMLRQRLMVIDRPRSKIAAEYRELTNSIIRQNLEDRDGAISVLDQALSDIRFEVDPEGDVSIQDKLQAIRTFHPRDKDVLVRLAQFRRGQRRMDEALDIFDQALQVDSFDSESLIGRAEILTVNGRSEAAQIDLLEFFKLPNTSPFSFSMATRLLLSNDQNSLPAMLASPALKALPLGAVMEMAHDLQRSYDTCEYAVSLLRTWLGENPGNPLERVAINEFSLCLIASGHFDEAIDWLSRVRGTGIATLSGAFNYAMAEWGKAKEIPKESFSRFTELIADDEEMTDANHLQCVSLAYWSLGEKALAESYYTRAVTSFSEAPRTIFSAWTYLYRSPKDFRHDLNAMRFFYDTGIGHPEFIR